MRVIFVDFAGTIVKHSDVVRKALYEYNLPFWKSRGFGGTAEELYRVLVETDRFFIQNRLNKGRPILPGEYEEMVARKLGLSISHEEAVAREMGFNSFYARNVSLVDGAAEGLAALSRIAPLFVFSHADTLRIVVALQRFDLLKYFAGIVPLSELGLRKPTGAAFEFIVKKLGTGHIIVGDKEHSDGVGEKYGFKFIDVRVGWDRVVDSVRSILIKDK